MALWPWSDVIRTAQPQAGCSRMDQPFVRTDTRCWKRLRSGVQAGYGDGAL